MSAKAAGRVWDLDLPHNKQHVLLAMADHADHEGRNMYPSLDLIAWKTGYSYRQVRRIVEELERAGILVMRKPARQQHPAVYDMDLSAGTAKPAFDRAARKKNGQNVHPEHGQNVHPEQSRVDILAPPGWTSEHARVDIAMSTKPWNHPIEPPPPTRASLLGDGDGGDFYRELRRRQVGQPKARQIASMSLDHAYILSLIDDRPNASDPNSLGRLINDICDGVVGEYVRPRASAPLQATRPNLPETTVAPAELLRQLRERR